jgi:ABC-type amino acid transport substrate-binding protein
MATLAWRRALSVFALLLLAAPAWADDTLVWATDGAYAPFAVTDVDGTPGGLDRAIAEAICLRIDRSCSFVTVPWPELFPRLGQGRFDVVFSGLSRATVVAAGLATSRTYFVAAARFVVRADTTGPIALDSGNFPIGVLAGTPHETYLLRRLADPDRLRRFPDEQELYLSLLGGGVDAVFGDGLALYEALIRHPAAPPVRFAGSAVSDAFLFDPDKVYAFAAPGDLNAAIDRAIAALQDDGTLARIVREYLPGYLESP